MRYHRGPYHRGLFSAVALMVAFLGGVVTHSLSYAGPATAKTPYAPLHQLSQVLVLMETQYVDPVERRHILDGAIKGMVAELDPHSAYMTPEEFARFNEDTEGEFGGIGVEVDFKDDMLVVVAPIEGSPAARAGVRSGDKLLAVDGKALHGMPMDKVVKLMRGKPGTSMRLIVKREGVNEPIPFQLKREKIQLRSAEGKRLAGDVLYLRLKQFQDGTHREMLEEIGRLRGVSAAPLRGVLLDVRSNPGGLINEAEAVADELLGAGAIYSTRHRGRVLEEVRAHAGGALSRLPLVALVNEYSASASELLVGALQDHKRATIVGATTFGKGSVQTIFQLQGGAGMRLTTMRYYTPKGFAIQANGVVPDIAVQYRPDNDAQLPALKEADLDGHLTAEHGAERTPKRLVDGGKRPDYVPVAALPNHPKDGQDVALRVAYETLIKAIQAKQR